MRLSFAGHRPRLAALLLSVGVLGTTASALPLVASQAATKVPFSLSLSESTVTVAPGSSATLTLSIVRTKGFSSPVYLGSRSVPKGVRISTGANPISRSTSVKVAVGDSVSPKTYFATLTGSSDCVFEHGKIVRLHDHMVDAECERAWELVQRRGRAMPS